MSVDVALEGPQRLLWSDLPEARPVVAKPAKSFRPRSLRGESLSSDLLGALEKPDDVLFLDIETTGLSRYYDEITLVGYLIAGEHRVMIAGDSPAELNQALAAARTLVTFNGTLFDIPFLKKTFEHIKTPSRHIDLRYVAKRAGLSGGQKAIERTLGVEVRSGLDDVDGAAAVILWHRYLRGDLSALRTLMAYNAADVLGMMGILDQLLEQSAPADFFVAKPEFLSRSLQMADSNALLVELPSPDRLGRTRPSFADIFVDTPAAHATVVGIDLTGSEAKPSGCCVLRGDEAWTEMLSTDDDIVGFIKQNAPQLVSIDSPLSLPRGRTWVTDDDPARREYGIMRTCERTLKRRGINVYPCLLPSMQRLTERGIRLADRLRYFGIPVIKSYPGAAQDILGIPRKGAGEEWLKLGLLEFGIRGEYATKAVRHDELDAITSALVGSFFLAGKYEPLGGEAEGSLIVPDLKATLGPPVIGISGRIAAGKTTAARILEQLGFAYARFSEVIDDEILRQGEVPTRSLRQRVGYQLHQERGQRWLSEQVIARVPAGRPLVIDGLRWPEDVAYFKERFGARFLHIHILAEFEHRAQRYAAAHDESLDFASIDTQPVERMVVELQGLAELQINNDSAIEVLDEQIRRVGENLLKDWRATCRSPSL